MNYIYNDLLHSIELTKQYLLEKGISYSMPNSSFQNDDSVIMEIFEELKIVKRGIYSSNGDVDKLNKYVSDFISIKYNPNYIAMVNCIKSDNECMTLRKVSNR